MAKVIVTETYLENIGDAIRSKLGGSDTYKPSEMAGAISQIHGDPVLEVLSVTENGTYNPSSGKDGFSQAVVNVPNSYSAGDEGKVVSNGALVAQTSDTVTENGTYDTTLKNEVVVNVAGGGGGDFALVFDEYLEMTGNSSQIIHLPYTVNSDYTVEMDYEATTSANMNVIVGTSGGGSQPHVTIYNSKYYCSAGGSEYNFTESFTGRHKFTLNKNNSIYFDDVAKVTNVTAQSSNYYYWIGGRGDGNYTTKAKIYGYKLTSITTGEDICNLQPAHILYKNNSVIAGFYDSVNDVFYGNANISIVSGNLISKTITENGTYNAYNDNADGYSNVTVNVSGGGGCIEEWDFTESLVGKVRGFTPTISGAVQDNSGVTFDNTSDYLKFGSYAGWNGITIEIDVGSMNLTSGTHRRFVMTDANNGLIYRSSGVWAFYANSWVDTTESDGSFFENSTLKIYVDVDGYWHIYKDDVLWFEPSRPLSLASQLYIGASGSAINNAVITGMRIY